MNRFEKKCFIGSATFHGVLLAVIFLGAAFSSNKVPSDMGPTITMIPNPGAAPSGNGVPPPAQPAKPAPPEPEPPQPKPEPVKQPDPEPVKPKVVKRDEPKETEKEKGDLPVPVKKPTDKKLVKEQPKTNAPSSLVSKTIRHSELVDPVTKRLADAKRQSDLRAAQAAKAADAARRAEAMAAVDSNVKGGNGTGLASNSRVVSPNPGGGIGGGEGVASGRYGDGLKAIYDSKWILPSDAFDDEASASVRVTVRRDGSVVSSAITKPSGNTSFDRSVKAVLNNVTRVLPFPPEMKESERVFTWRFEKRTRAG